MASNISEDETQQLLRTIEMFEAITESQPEDYQSLEILKETYNKLGRQVDSLRISKKLANAYINLGQLSQAILEYEGILQECPSDSAAQTALAELEKKTKFGSATPLLTEDSKPTTPAGVSAGASALSPDLPADSDQVLANALIAEKIVTIQSVQPLLQRLSTARRTNPDKTQPVTLLQLIANEQIAKMEDLLAVIVAKSGLPYIPLTSYDVDRDAAFLLPQEVCWQNCIVCFDFISRCALVAISNPFDQAARKQVEILLDQTVFWYLSPPAEIIATLRRVNGLEASKTSKS
jgi:tetratricopeptide (TPR) repeat protein